MLFYSLFFLFFLLWMSYLGPSQYTKVISPENSKKSQTHFSILSTEYWKKTNQQINLGLLSMSLFLLMTSLEIPIVIFSLNLPHSKIHSCSQHPKTGNILKTASYLSFSVSVTITGFHFFSHLGLSRNLKLLHCLWIFPSNLHYLHKITAPKAPFDPVGLC